MRKRVMLICKGNFWLAVYFCLFLTFRMYTDDVRNCELTQQLSESSEVLRLSPKALCLVHGAYRGCPRQNALELRVGWSLGIWKNQLSTTKEPPEVSTTPDVISIAKQRWPPGQKTCEPSPGSVTRALPCVGRILHEKAQVVTIQTLVTLRPKHHFGVLITPGLVSYLTTSGVKCDMCL